MSTTPPTVYSDDPDAHMVWPVTDPAGNNLEFTPVCAVSGGDYDIAATWLGDPAPTRDLRVPLTGAPAGSTVGVYLQNPGGNDIRLGSVYVAIRR